MSVRIRVTAEGDVELVLQLDQPRHRKRAGAIHPDFSVVIHAHEGKRRIDGGVDHIELAPGPLRDGKPVFSGSAPQRIDPDAEAGRFDDIEVDHTPQVPDVFLSKIERTRRGGALRALIRDPFHVPIAIPQQFIRPFFDPPGGVGVGRTAVRRVIFHAAILRRIVRRREDQAVRQPGRAGAIVIEDRERNSGRRRRRVIRRNKDVHAVSREHLERGALRRRRDGVRVLSQIQRPGVTARAAIFDDGLRDGGDVGVSECAVQRSATMATGAERDGLLGVAGIGLLFVIGAFESRGIDEQRARGRLAGKWMRHASGGVKREA